VYIIYRLFLGLAASLNGELAAQELMS